MLKGLSGQTLLSQPISETRAASTAGGGSALTTTAARIVLPDGTDAFVLLTRNFSTAVVVKWAPCPYLVVLKTTDSLATATDYSGAAQDGDAGTDVVLSSLATLANGGAVYVGSHLPFRGLYADVDAANANASMLAAHYWNGTAWTDLSPTDGTGSGGATFAQDGSITWTVPTAWSKSRLKSIDPSCAAAVGPRQHDEMYWVRLSVSAALDSSTTLNALLSLPRSTAYAELVEGSVQEVTAPKGRGGIAAIEALTDAGTANLIVNAQTWAQKGFAS